MRYIILTIIILSIIAFPTVGQASPAVSANNAILMEASTGRVLFEKNAYERQSIASITKIMTAIIAIESGKLDKKVTASRKAVYTEGSSIYLEQGEKMTLEDLLYGLMLRSGNDAAVAISEYVGGSEEGFTFLMNEKAKWLGMNDSNFMNPHGLDAKEHYSSAYDMALLTKYAMGNKKFRAISGEETYLSDSRTYSWRNKNKLLTQYYEYCTGGKTGYTKKTGRTLVTTAEKDGLELIAVTLDAPDDWNDHIQLFEWGFKNYKMKTLEKKGEKLYKLDDINDLSSGYIRDDLEYPLTEDETNEVVQKNVLLAKAKQSPNQPIGKSVFYLNNQPILQAAVYKNPNRRELAADLKLMIEKVMGMNSLW
ncbi:D-alanyl-D-alanine carboxypeptidase family protein [Virgibacillus sp. SK37]|uniref:D-alanyl-D-alanine carboxypeptidase family protein n=1 Tax=Virgibacillus sp. SK37 TaxID=403957 RepID=UPI0004D0FD80|nr:D-alanyl-D-alanine carboxypeptidase family protein [Virgibacillus sp. SK37]AIF43530.1 D-alanyl-D-alanine carboxypeptidase [Virgibacillus sp. SK37]